MTDTWTKRLQAQVRGCEFYGPTDMGSPAPGVWVVSGPTSEWRHSTHSIEHAALLYLVQVCRDPDAKKALTAFEDSIHNGVGIR